MCELLIKATDYTHPDPDVDLRGSYKRGYIVEVRPDNCEYGTSEVLPKFCVIKLPTIEVERALKYMQPETVEGTIEGMVIEVPFRRRRWQIRWDDLPQEMRDKLTTDGVITVKFPTYHGKYDYTWQEIRNYFRDLKTGLDESGDL